MTKEELDEIKQLRERLTGLEQKEEDLDSIIEAEKIRKKLTNSIWPMILEINDLQGKVGQYEIAIDELQKKLSFAQSEERGMPFFGIPVETTYIDSDTCRRE